MKAVKKPRCFKCGKVMDSAVKTDDVDDYWNAPCDGVVFDGGSNFGSSLYDALVDHRIARIVVCDDCLRANRDMIREYDVCVTCKAKSTKDCEKCWIKQPRHPKSKNGGVGFDRNGPIE